MPVPAQDRRHREARLDSPRKPARRLPVVKAFQAFFNPEIRAWRGEQPLKTVFWGYGFLVNLSVGAIYYLSLDVAQTAHQQALLIFITAYMVWLLVSIWRSTNAVGNALWGTLARHLVVVWAANAIMIVVFLELDLIAKYFSS
jgi:hypothetical protein